MSRVEEITEKLIQMMTAESEWVKTGIELEEVNNGIRRVAEGVATHVERLLADERERLVTEHKACEDTYIKELETLRATVQRHSFEMEAEREKVREMCAFEACQICWNSRAHPDEHGPAYLETKSGPHKGHWIHKLIFGKRDFPCRCRADHLRQLDLTKDLAPSTEENWLPMYHYGCPECKAYAFNPEKIPHTVSCRNQHKSKRQQVTRLDEGGEEKVND